MAFARGFDEVFLRLSSIFLRAIETFSALFILSAVAKFMTDLTDIDVIIPGAVITIEAIACAAAAYAGFVVLPTFCGGEIFFKSIRFFDFVFAGLFIFCAVLFSGDMTDTCAAFGKKYFGADTYDPVYYDCHLMRAVFAFCIISIVSFAFSFGISVGLHRLELSPDGFRGRFYRQSNHHHHNQSDREMGQTDG